MKYGVKTIVVSLIILAAVAFLVMRDKKSPEVQVPQEEIVTNIENVVYGDSYEVLVKNISKDKTLAPGMYVVHTSDFDMNYTSEEPSVEFTAAVRESLISDYIKSIKRQDGYKDVYQVQEEIKPGEEFSFPVRNKEEGGLYLSGFHGVREIDGTFSMLTPLELRGTSSQVLLTQYALSGADNSGSVAVDVDNLNAIVRVTLTSLND
jgi:hypothetical protein